MIWPTASNGELRSDLTTPLATFIGLFSNVGETQGGFHQDQIDWFKAELAAADPELALVVTVHHPPFSGDIEHSGSSMVADMLFDSFAATGRYPHLILSGHVHNYQRFTKLMTAGKRVTCVVAGAGGHTNLKTIHQVKGAYPKAPLVLEDGLTLEQYDQDTGTYFSTPCTLGSTPAVTRIDDSSIDLA